MPNKRKRNPPPISSGKRGKIVKSGAKNNFEDETVPEANSRELMYDDIDEFHSDRDKILLGSDEEDEHDKEEYEEVLPLGGESDSLSDNESERDELLDNDYYERMAKKDEIASDLEDEDDGLPDVKAWGKRKGTYYDTDYVDGDYGGFTGEDEELAQAEEKEALAIQKRLLQQINEDDFGIDWLKPVEQEKGEVEEEKVTLDLSRMSRNEKLELLKKESPEFLELVDDFQTLLKEVNDKLSPLVPYAKQGKLVKGAEYILLKHELALLYCTNISFYMVLKSKGILTRNHPVIKKLAYFKKFLKELKVVDDQLSPYIESALEKLRNNEVLEASTEVPSSDAKPDKETKAKTKKLRIIAEMEEKSAQTKKVRFEDEKKPNKKRLETNDEKEALKMYQEVNEQRKKGFKSSKQELEQGSDDDDDDDGSQSDDQEVNDVDGEEEIEQDADQELNEKRGITYQIAKNKGLMPHRKKEYRNPRVKHRIKFRKAKIRRKGQVREPRKELQRYGGETSGIRVGVKHGRKLK